MKTINTIWITLLTLIISTGVTDLLQAQDDSRTNAVMAYNNARELAGINEYLDAIELYEEALTFARADDCEDCGDIEEMIVGQVPRVYLARGLQTFENFREERTVENVNRAIEHFEEAAEGAARYNATTVQGQARGVIPQLYYQKSLVQYNEEDYEAALASLDTAIELNENYTLAYYQKAIVLNKMGEVELDDVIAAFDRAIEVGLATNQQEHVATAQRRLSSELVYRAVSLKDEDDLAGALEMLEMAQDYDDSSVDLWYRLAEVQNLLGNANSALESANRALELESGGVADQAKIYFELGQAYQALEQVTNACNAYENAAYGDFRDSALYEMEYELECEEISS